MNKKRKKGFTLVEIIIYFGLVSIILILIIGFSLNIFESTNKNNVYREIQQNGRFIMQKKRLLRQNIKNGMCTT